jgi:quinol monooxygenase YgiN
MFIVQVWVHVKPDQIEAFKAITAEDAHASLKDPGVVRFDLLQQTEDPARFVLYEVYRSRADGEYHLETEHFQHWRAAVAGMVADQPPQATTYRTIFSHEATL